MSNHSPQPWTCQQSYSGPEWQGNGDIFIHSGPFHVATVHRHRPEFQLDDAKLIKAAPSLLYALRTLLPVAQAFEKQASQGSSGRRGAAVFALARKALAEAEGELTDPDDASRSTP